MDGPQFLDLYGLQQCTNYYRSKFPCYKIPVKPLFFLNYLSCSLNSSYVVITLAISIRNCCMQFMTLQTLNQMFMSEKQSDAK